MTRINTIPVQELENDMLLAEYVELPRVFGLVYRAEKRGITPDTYGIPALFCLGPGHVKFFSNKLTWLINRFSDTVDELTIRGYNLQYKTVDGLLMPSNPAWFNNWEPTIESQSLIRQRIKDNREKARIKKEKRK